jgi:hypothetical protein
MNEQQAEAYGSDTHERILAIKARLTRLGNVETRLRKLNIALANIAVADRPQQLKLIRSARSYVETKIKPEPVQGISADLRIIDNELQSLYEGIKAKSATMSDLVLMSGVRAISNVRTLISSASIRLTQLESATEAHADSSALAIEQAREAMSQIPAFDDDREFIVWRCPVAFSGTNSSDSKFSKVGYMSVEKLDHLGFAADTIGGYTVIKKQLCIGINPKTLYREVELKDEKGEPIFEEDGTTPKVGLKRRTVKEWVQKNKAGKPVKVQQRRERTAHDEALAVMKMMEEKTASSYTLISQKPTSFKGGTWFWVMSSQDVRRFTKAFPGGRVDIQKWGFAGEQTSSAPKEAPRHLTPRDQPGYRAI